MVAAFPKGSLDIQSSVDRIEGYTNDIRKLGVEIVDSIETLLTRVDVVMLETNDGRRHLEQALPVLKAGKRLFIDKPMAASLSDAMAIFDAADTYGVPVFSASSLRYIKGMKEVKEGSAGKILGAETFSPATLEKTHPDFFWYGIHGVETLFTAMGPGCKRVVRISTPDTDVAVGTWSDGRIGSFRGLRAGKRDYGGTIYRGEGQRGTGCLQRIQSLARRDHPVFPDRRRSVSEGRNPGNPRIYGSCRPEQKEGRHTRFDGRGHGKGR